jgi:hypothetical protein
MHKMNGFYEYGVSPYQLKTFKGFINPGFPHWVKRTARQLIFIGPPFLFYYQLSQWAVKKVTKMSNSE